MANMNNAAERMVRDMNPQGIPPPAAFQPPPQAQIPPPAPHQPMEENWDTVFVDVLSRKDGIVGLRDVLLHCPPDKVLPIGPGSAPLISPLLILGLIHQLSSHVTLGEGNEEAVTFLWWLQRASQALNVTVSRPFTCLPR